RRALRRCRGPLPAPLPPPVRRAEHRRSRSGRFAGADPGASSRLRRSLVGALVGLSGPGPVVGLPFTMKTSESFPSFGRFEAQFLRQYRWLLALALLGLFLQSLLLLPIPVLQGWVLDVLVAGSKPAASAVCVIVASLVATVGCHLARMVLAWRV